jgi:hypothetical protein
MLKNINQPIKETKMLEMKTTYQSKNWDKKLSQWCKENREKKQIKINLIKEMKKDNDLKKYVNDIEKLNFEQFTVLINIFKKVNLNQ